MKTTKIIAYLLISTLMIMTFGCAAAPTSDTASGNDRDLVIAVGAEPNHLTTFSEQQSSDNDQVIQFNIYDTLFYMDTTTGTIKPWLAKSWEISPDGKQIKIALRDDVYFHDDTKMTAQDVKFTFDNEKNYPLGKSMLVNYDRTEVVDDYNCIIYMTAPYNAILNALASRASCIMSKAYFDKVGLQDYNAAPIGTGPYKFVSSTSGESIVLERNDKYWGKAPAFKKVTVKTITDVNTEILALESGDIDVVLNAPIENLQHLSNPDVAWDSTGSNATQWLGFNMIETNWVSKDLNFRKAVQYAIDKDAINNSVYGGKATIVDIYGAPSFTTRPAESSYSTYAYNMEKAKEYLKASNYDGREFNVVVKGGTADAKAAEVIQGSLYQIGVNMKVTAVDSATFYDTTRTSGDYDAQLTTTTSSVLDLDSLCLYFLKAKYYFKNQNYPHADEMDQLLQDQRQNPDQNKRLEDITQVVNYVNDDAVTIYNLVDVNTIAYKNDLKGVTPNMAKYYRIIEWSY